jgi:hypothetical protein
MKTLRILQQKQKCFEYAGNVENEMTRTKNYEWNQNSKSDKMINSLNEVLRWLAKKMYYITFAQIKKSLILLLV